MPDIAATSHGAVFLIIVGDFNAVQDPFRRSDLIWPHDHQHVLGSKDAVLGQDIQNRMPGKEGPGEVDQIRNHAVIGIGPEAGELEAVTGLFLLLLTRLCILDGIEPGAVGIILGVRSVADHEDLNILEQTGASPEGIALISVNLIESFPDSDPAPFQLHMDHREAVDQDRHIIAIAVPRSFILADGILIDDLKKVVMDVLLINQGDVFGGTVITLQDLNKVFLNLPRLFNNMIVRVCQGIIKESVPFGIGKGITVQSLQFLSEIRDHLCLRMDRKIFIALFGEFADKIPLEISLTLITVRSGFYRLIFRDNGVLRSLGNNIEIRHTDTSLSLQAQFIVSSLSL